jgi:hypothetical protein
VITTSLTTKVMSEMDNMEKMMRVLGLMTTGHVTIVLMEMENRDKIGNPTYDTHSWG